MIKEQLSLMHLRIAKLKQELEESIAERTKMRRERFDEIIRSEKDINMKLSQRHFDVQRPSLILKSLYSIDDKETNNDLLDMVSSSLTDLKLISELCFRIKKNKTAR